MEYKRLGDIATYINGYPFKPEDRGAKGLPIIRIQDLTGNAYDLGLYNGDYPERIEINDGDVLISWSASLGVYVWDRGKALLNQHIFKVVFDKVDVDKQYFVYAVQHKLREMESKTHGATMKHIVKKDFDNTMIPFPELETQTEIAELLSKTKRIITARQQQLSALDDLIKARFVEMFDGGDYPQATIADLVAEKVSSVKKDFAQDDTIKYIDISSIDNQRNIMTGYTEYILSEAPSRAQQHIIEGDILISTVRPNLRNVAMTTYTDDNLVASSGFCVLRASKCLPSYLMAIVCSDEFTGAMSRVVTGANYPAIKDSDVLSYVVSVPPMGKQLEFEAFTTQIDKSKSVIQKSLDETQLLFDSLMQEYFG